MVTLTQQTLGETLEAYLADLQAAGRSPLTIESYRGTLATLTRFVAAHGIEDWSDVSPNDLRQYLTALQGNGLKSSSVGVAATITSSFFNWLDIQGLVQANPMQRVKRPRKPQRIVKTFTDAELRAMFAAAGSSPNPARNKVILSLLLDCGLRASELLSVEPSDYDWATSTLTVKGKGRKVRLLGVGRRSKEVFEAYLRCVDGNLWNLRRPGLAKVIRTLGNRAGVKAHCHLFRHTFACRFLDAGGTIDELQYLLGHASIVITMIYACAGQEARARRSHAMHSPLDALG